MFYLNGEIVFRKSPKVWSDTLDAGNKLKSTTKTG